MPCVVAPRSHGPLADARRQSDAELLALVVGRSDPAALGRAAAALAAVGGARGLLLSDPSRLRAAGVGPAVATRLIAALELARRAIAANALGRALDSPEDAAGALAPHVAHLEREAVKVALLTRQNRLIEVVPVCEGDLAHTSLRIGELFVAAVRSNAARLVIIHNHPSGDATPSLEDERASRAAVRAGRLLGIDVVDHIIFGAGSWVSLRRMGRLSPED